LLADERHAASERLRVCEAAVGKALAGVLGIAADGFVQEIRNHEAEIRRLQAKLLGHDRYCATTGGMLPDARADVRPAARGRRQQQHERPTNGQLAPASQQTPHVAAVLSAQAKKRA
jgi:hypothetical protein